MGYKPNSLFKSYLQLLFFILTCQQHTALQRNMSNLEESPAHLTNILNYLHGLTKFVSHAHCSLPFLAGARTQNSQEALRINWLWSPRLLTLTGAMNQKLPSVRDTQH